MESEKENSAFVDRQKVSTIQALIELYKLEFGAEWTAAFISTVVCHIGDH